MNDSLKPNMTEWKDPKKRNSDGTFCVEICVGLLSTDTKHLAALMQHWILEEWMPNNSAWTIDWRTGKNLSITREETHFYKDDFIKPPNIISTEDSKLRLRLYGSKSTTFWRDWLIMKIMPDLRTKFPEIGEIPEYIKLCEE
jgi:hypothetical protein